MANLQFRCDLRYCNCTRSGFVDRVDDHNVMAVNYWLAIIEHKSTQFNQFLCDKGWCWLGKEQHCFSSEPPVLLYVLLLESIPIVLFSLPVTGHVDQQFRYEWKGSVWDQLFGWSPSCCGPVIPPTLSFFLSPSDFFLSFGFNRFVLLCFFVCFRPEFGRLVISLTTFALPAVLDLWIFRRKGRDASS